MEYYLITFGFSFLVSITLILLFRKLDKQSSNLSKVRRFVGEQIKEIDKIFDSKRREYDKTIAELDEVMMKSNSTVDFFRNQMEILDSKLETLSSNDNKIKDVEKKLSKISEMAKEADRNVKLLQKDEHDIRKLGGRVKFIKTELLEVEKRIPKLEQDLIKESDRKIKIVS